jgi:hypothetical protein
MTEIYGLNGADDISSAEESEDEGREDEVSLLTIFN